MLFGTYLELLIQIYHHVSEKNLFEIMAQSQTSTQFWHFKVYLFWFFFYLKFSLEITIWQIEIGKI